MRRRTKFGLLTMAGWLLAGASAHAATDEKETRVFLRSGVLSDDLRGHDQVRATPPSVLMLGAAIVRQPNSFEMPWLNEAYITYSASLMGGQTVTTQSRATRLIGDLSFAFNARGNRYFGLAGGYRFSRGEDKAQTAPGALVSVRTTMHSLRLGAVGATPIFEPPQGQPQNLSQRLVTSFYAAAGNQATATTGPIGSSDSRLFVGPELAIGYEVKLKSGMVIDARYRTALYITEFDAPSRGQTENSVVLSVGWAFGPGRK